MKHFWIVLFAFLSGCAAFKSPPVETPAPTPIVVQVPPVIDYQCADMSKFVKNIVGLHIIGVTANDLDQYISAPAVSVFPIRLLKKEAFDMKVDTPEDAYTQFYKLCVDTGYNQMLDYLKIREEQRVTEAVRQSAPPPIVKKKKPKGKPKAQTNGPGNRKEVPR